LERMPRHSQTRYIVLTPNSRAVDQAAERGVCEIAIFASASETFSRRNLNRSIDDSLKMFAVASERALALGVRVRWYVSMIAGAPIEGRVAVDDVCRVARSMRDIGCDEISLGDTSGVGTPPQVGQLVEQIGDQVGLDRLAVHMHDTYGMGLA